MRFDIITLFPEMFASFHAWGVTGRALVDSRISLQTWNPRTYTQDRHASVDDRPYGGGPGMVMLYQPLADAITAAQADGPAAKVIYLSPQGRTLTQGYLESLAQEPRLILLAGRYEGVDERLVDDYVDEELSIGDYVLSGGEFAAFVVIDALARLLPGTLGNQASAQQDSFVQGLLDYPHYTRPSCVNAIKVPDVLLSGNHALIERWRLKQALGRTWLRRPDLLAEKVLKKEEASLLSEFKRESDLKK